MPLLKPQSQAPLRILLVEDDELFRLGLRVRLQQEPTLTIAAEAEDGESALALAQEQGFDVILMDVGLPGIGGIEACRQLKQQHPAIPILILTSHNQKTLITRLIEAGAQGYCLKGIAAETLVLALRSVAVGASWWDSTATQEIQSAFTAQPEVEASPKASPSKPSAALTQREQEILALLAQGKTNQEIADLLYIAAGTVRVHVHSVLHKLEARDRTQAVIIALQKQLLPKLT